MITLPEIPEKLPFFKLENDSEELVSVGCLFAV